MGQANDSKPMKAFLDKSMAILGHTFGRAQPVVAALLLCGLWSLWLPRAWAIDLTEAEQAYLQGLDKVTMCVNPDWEPYERINGHGEHEGIAADLLKLIAERAGIRLELVITRNWEESLSASQNGRCQILAFLNQPPQRDSWLLFTQPYFTDPNVFITREEHPFIPDAASLAGEIMAIPGGTMIEERLREASPNLVIVQTASEAEALKMVEDREADVTLRSLTMAAYTIRKEGLFKLKIAGKVPGFENQFRIGANKNQPLLRDILDKSIATLGPEEVKAIVNRHVFINVVSPANYVGLIKLIIGLSVLSLAVSFWSWQLKRLNRKLARQHADLVALSGVLQEDIAARKRAEEKLEQARTDLEKANRELRRSEERHRLLADNCSDVIWTMELDGKFTYVSPSVERLRGYSPLEVMAQSMDEALTPTSLPFAEENLARARAAVRDGKTIQDFRGELEQPRKDGSTVWTEVTVSGLYNGDGAFLGLLGVARDITERRASEQRIKHLAQHDSLTGLPNRTLFSDRLQQALTLRRRQGGMLAVLFFDLDRFKSVNDLYGHEIGDLLLKRVALRIREGLRDSDTLARLGGDEFVLLLPDIENASNAAAVADKIRTLLTHTFYLGEYRLHISSSIGIALFPDHGSTEHELLKNADTAMYRAKHGGRDGVDMLA